MCRSTSTCRIGPVYYYLVLNRWPTGKRRTGVGFVAADGDQLLEKDPQTPLFLRTFNRSDWLHSAWGMISLSTAPSGSIVWKGLLMTL